MAHFEIDSRHQKWGIALGVIVFGLALLDVVALKGEVVAGGSVNLAAESEPLVLTIDRPYEEHTVEIYTRKSGTGTKSKGRSIAWELVAPNGNVVAEGAELVSHKRRYFDFFPVEPGDYALHAHETKLLGSARGTGNVHVTVGDRRVVSRALRF